MRPSVRITVQTRLETIRDCVRDIREVLMNEHISDLEREPLAKFVQEVDMMYRTVPAWIRLQS